VTLSLRNKRVRVYAYQDGGANGVVNVIYPFTGEWWASVVETSGRQTTPALQSEHIVDAVIEFGDEAVVTPNGLLKVVETGERYFVRAIVKRPASRAIQVYGERVDDAVFAGPALIVTPSQVDLPAGFAQQLTAVVYDESGDTVLNPTIAWSSSDPAIATVDSSGNVTAVANGSCVITATYAPLAVGGQCTMLVQDLFFGP
jgi:uncharacterized protein YjdB